MLLLDLESKQLDIAANTILVGIHVVLTQVNFIAAFIMNGLRGSGQQTGLSQDFPERQGKKSRVPPARSRTYRRGNGNIVDEDRAGE